MGPQLEPGPLYHPGLPALELGALQELEHPIGPQLELGGP